MSGVPDHESAPSDHEALAPAPFLNRRRVLSLAAGLGGSVAAIGIASQLPLTSHSDTMAAVGPPATPMDMDMSSHSDHETVSPYAATPVPWEHEELVEPEVRQSVDGVLSTSLTISYTYKDVSGYRLYLRSYDGMIPGPTLRVKPGDLLKIEMINNLPPNRDPMPANMNVPHNLNTVNFHAHGAHVSPSGISDNILRSMEPGSTSPIEISFADDHPRGTYWYHPHHHGSADIQVASGMVGSLIIEGDFDDIPEIATAKERVLVFAQTVFDSLRTVEDFELLWSETATRFHTINGQREPIIRMRPGEVQRWRLVNAGYQDDIMLSLKDHDIHAIAYDGISHDRIDSVSELLLAPGQRADILVKAGDPGTYLLSALPHDQGYPAPEGPLGTVVVEGEPLPMNLPGALSAAPLAAIPDSELTGKREIVFSANAPEADAAGHYGEFDFLVNGKVFDPNRIDHRIPLGSVEEWTVRNTHFHDHIFHIHVNPFIVTTINDEPQAEPVWRDTVIVPRGGSIVFRTRFIDFTGMYVLHCHMMNHEALGMMQLIEVYDPN